MANEYWDVGMWKETPTGKNFFIKLGSAKQTDDGGFVCYLDALPMPGPKGGCRISIKPQQRREYGGDRQISSAPDSRIPGDDSPPF